MLAARLRVDSVNSFVPCNFGWKDLNGGDYTPQRAWKTDLAVHNNRRSEDGCTMTTITYSVQVNMTNSIRIAAGVLGDHEWCAQLMASSEPWISLGQDLEACRKKLTRPGVELFIARDQKTERRLGFVLIAPHGLAWSPYISSIAVASEAQGHGVGAQLLQFTEQHYADRKHLFLMVSSFNERAQQFYRRHGYEFIGEVKDYVVTGQSELIFHKKLS